MLDIEIEIKFCKFFLLLIKKFTSSNSNLLKYTIPNLQMISISVERIWHRIFYLSNYIYNMQWKFLKGIFINGLKQNCFMTVFNTSLDLVYCYSNIARLCEFKFTRLSVFINFYVVSYLQLNLVIHFHF